jgi:putative transposase
MAEEWRSAAELARLTLPATAVKAMGLRAWPSTEQGINGLAKRLRWSGQRRADSSRAWEYAVADLPQPIKTALAKTMLKAAPVPAPVQLDLPLAADLKTHQRTAMEARAVLLAEIDRLVMSGIGRSKAVEALVEMAGTGALSPILQGLVPVANARSNGSRSLTRATLYNWLKARDAAAGNVVALAPTTPPESPVPDWAPTFMKLWGLPSKPGMAEILDDHWPQGVAKPSYDQVRRFIKRLDALTKNRGRMGPRALKALQAYVARDVSELWPGAIFIGDGHTFKAEVAHPIHGRPFRPEVTSFLDAYTRKWVGWSVDLVENTWAVADALRHAVVTNSCCDIVYYDNGAGAKNATWDADCTGLAARLSITKLHSAPWTSQSRGIIERFNSSVLHKAARWLPTYMGQRMDKEAKDRAFKITRAEIKATGASRLLPAWADFRAFIDELMAVYNARPHASLPLIVAEGKRRHMSPNEAWAKAIAEGWNPDPISEAEATDLFRPALKRTVKRGLVELFGNAYYHDALRVLHDEKVSVGFDIHDANKVWVRMADGRFVCEAIWNGHKRSYVPVSFAERAQEKRVAGKIARLDDHRATALAELPGRTLDADRVLTPAEQARLDEIEAEFEEVPSEAEIAEVPAIALRLAEIERELAASVPVPPPGDEATFGSSGKAAFGSSGKAAFGSGGEAAFGSGVVQLRPQPLSAKAQQFTRALEIEARIAAGAEISEVDRTWLAAFQRHSTYLSMKDFAANFGLETALAM